MERLLDRAREQAALMEKEDWFSMYRLNSPRFQAVCKSGDFALTTGFAVSFLRSLMGFQDNDKLGAVITGATIDGDIGMVFGEMTRNGEIVELSSTSDGDSWVFIDGEWWAESEDWQDGCDPAAIFTP